MTGNVFQLPSDWIVGGHRFRVPHWTISNRFRMRSPATVFSSDFFADGGAVGDKYTREFFGELEIPVIAGQPAAEELVFNISARFTDDEFYGGAWTHSYKMAYRPDQLAAVPRHHRHVLPRTEPAGTLYRAPDRLPHGIRSVPDPRRRHQMTLSGVYIPANDDRRPSCA